MLVDPVKHYFYIWLIHVTKTSKTLAAMQGLRPLFLLRSRLAPKQASASRLRRRNSLRASGLHHSKKNQENRLARSLTKTHQLTKLTNSPTHKTYFRIVTAEGSGPPGLWTSRRDSLFSWFSFVSASSSDKGGFAVCGVKAVRGEASHKPSPRKRQRVLGPDDDTKGFLGFGFKTKMHWICRVRR